MTFTKKQQKDHREAFIHECRQKAWGAACHADWISNGLDTVMAEFQRLQDDDRALAEEIKALENAVDYHTVDNRDKRKALQERRNSLKNAMEAIAKSVQQGQQALSGLYQSIESNLQLAKHAEGGVEGGGGENRDLREYWGIRQISRYAKHPINSSALN
jgi:chromosome segregation ATPase